MDEKWRPIPEWEGIYSVSNQGRVRRDRGGKGYSAGKILALNKDNMGYPRVMLCDLRTGRYGKKTRIHRLVMLAFEGPPPPNRPEVNHIDGNRANNHLSNLEYVTHAANLKHAHTHLQKWHYTPEERRQMSERMRGKRNKASLTDEEATTIHNTYHQADNKDGLQGALALLYGVSKATVWQIVHGRTYKG
jgi:hypothetical protein